MTDRDILDLVHNLVGDDFAQDLAWHALPDNQPSHEEAVRLMREASERIGLIYSIVHGHLPRECHHVHGAWRELAARMHAGMVAATPATPEERERFDAELREQSRKWLPVQLSENV